jgi:hypothetical protein
MLKKECTVRMIENRVLMEVFGPKGKEVAGDWKKNIVIRSTFCVRLAKWYLSDKMKEDEKDRI